jgi:DNA-binding HxlR family transcriptional regulator
VDLRSGLAVEAIGLLTGDLRPFAGKPRACDLYAIHPLIQGTVRRAVVHVSDDDWPQAWETLTHVSRGISTTLRGELGGPLPADLLLSIAVEQATPARRASVDEAIHSEFEQQAGGRYYSDLARYLRQALPAISPHTLTSRLRQFETYGIVTRTTYAEIPPRVEYQLTPLSEGLRDVLDAMATWADSVPFPEDTKLVRKLSDL